MRRIVSLLLILVLFASMAYTVSASSDDAPMVIPTPCENGWIVTVRASQIHSSWEDGDKFNVVDFQNADMSFDENNVLTMVFNDEDYKNGSLAVIPFRNENKEGDRWLNFVFSETGVPVFTSSSQRDSIMSHYPGMDSILLETNTNKLPVIDDAKQAYNRNVQPPSEIITAAGRGAISPEKLRAEQFGVIADADENGLGGELAGYIYSTDIRAYINGVEVPSYNIGGRTVVIAEDITDDCKYQDEYRTLIMGELAPANLNRAVSDLSGEPGNIIGNIYKTDIKTYIYDKELVSYNLGGKTAVVIEELGDDQRFSDVGGRYVWNEEDRTISLEFMYGTEWEDFKAELEITVNEDRTEAEAVFLKDAAAPDGLSMSISYTGNTQSDEAPVMIPVMTEINGTRKLLGYDFGHNSKFFEIDANGHAAVSNDYRQFIYLYPDVMEEACRAVSEIKLTRDEVISSYIIRRAANIDERYDTDDYSFLYMSGPAPYRHYYLLLVRADGTYHDYAEDVDASVGFAYVNIDKENEKVYFRYDKDYVIDLKTGEMTAVPEKTPGSY